MKTQDIPLLAALKRSLVDLENIEKIVVREWEKVLKCPLLPFSFSTPHIVFHLYPYDNTVYSVYRQNPDYRVSTFEGYSVVKEFYSGRPEREDYIPGKQEYSRTLYWNPGIELDATGRARVSFYNNSFCRQIDVSAEGLTPEGLPVVGK